MFELYIDFRNFWDLLKTIWRKITSRACWRRIHHKIFGWLGFSHLLKGILRSYNKHCQFLVQVIKTSYFVLTSRIACVLAEIYRLNELHLWIKHCWIILCYTSICLSLWDKNFLYAIFKQTILVTLIKVSIYKNTIQDQINLWKIFPKHTTHDFEKVYAKHMYKHWDARFDE